MKEDKLLSKIFKKIGSLKITLILLFIIAISSILGTLILQKQEAEFYMQKYGTYLGGLILNFGADNFYNSIYYNVLLFCLGVNLFFCSINSFKKDYFKNIYKISVLLIHLGILVIFTAALISKFTKEEQKYTLFPSEKIILEKESAQIKFNKFSIDYYDQSTTVKEYKSFVDVFEDGNLRSSHTISVNNPLVYKGISFYQDSFLVLSDIDIKITYDGKVVWDGLWEHNKSLEVLGKTPLRFEMDHFIPDFIKEGNKLFLRSYKPVNSAILISIYEKDELLKKQWIFSNIENNNDQFEFKIKEIRPVYATVIKKVEDYGLGFVVFGFALIFSGMILLIYPKIFK